MEVWTALSLDCSSAIDKIASLCQFLSIVLKIAYERFGVSRACDMSTGFNEDVQKIEDSLCSVGIYFKPSLGHQCRYWPLVILHI